MKMVTGVHLMRDHHWKRMPAMAPELLSQSGRPELGVGLGHVEPPAVLVQINRRRLVGRKGPQPGQVGRRRYHFHSVLRHPEQPALGQEAAGPFDFRSEDREQLTGWW